MGFSGGGSNILKSHQHDGTVAQDGGSLDMNNVTQAALSSGDIVYSDGSHLQSLSIGGSGQLLNSTGSLPQWSTVATGATTTRTILTLSAELSSTSTSFVTMTGLSTTLGNNTGGSYTATFCGSIWINNNPITVGLGIDDGGSNVAHVGRPYFRNGTPELVNFYGMGSDATSNTVAMQWKLSSSDTMYSEGASSPDSRSSFSILEVY